MTGPSKIKKKDGAVKMIPGKQVGFKLLPLVLLDKAPWNYKTDDAKKLEKLKTNIAENGFLQNLIVRQMDGGRWEVVNGNHRHDACTELGHEEVMCYDLGEISLAKAQKIAWVTNDTAFENDQIKLSAMVNSILTEFNAEDLVKELNYNTEEIEAMSKLVSFDFGQFQSNVPELPPMVAGGTSADPIPVEHRPPNPEVQLADTGNSDTAFIQLEVPRAVFKGFMDILDEIAAADSVDKPKLTTRSESVQILVEILSTKEIDELLKNRA